jgi:hypothetical protein
VCRWTRERRRLLEWGALRLARDGSRPTDVEPRGGGLTLLERESRDCSFRAGGADVMVRAEPLTEPVAYHAEGPVWS